jgi:hypothetical protein
MKGRKMRGEYQMLLPSAVKPKHVFQCVSTKMSASGATVDDGAKTTKDYAVQLLKQHLLNGRGQHGVLVLGELGQTSFIACL